jgi:MoaA/NifB/PqqE/SkfB family radical SAM enzyme
MLNLNTDPQIVLWALTKDTYWHPAERGRTTERHGKELSTAEIFSVIDDMVHHFVHAPVVILTGNNVWQREDFGQILRKMASALPSAIALNSPRRVNSALLPRWKESGLTSVYLRLQNPHTLQGRRAIELAEVVADQDMRLEIMTSVTSRTLPLLPVLADLMVSLGASSWQLSFNESLGRSKLNAKTLEQTLVWLADFAASAPLRVLPIGAPHYQRILSDRYPLLDAGRIAIREARGIAYINYQGLVYPGVNLPFVGGNLRQNCFSNIYRESPMFCALRDPRPLEGRCGFCDYHLTCGGSRTRAFVETGKLYAEDPGCWDPQTA